MCLRNGAKVTSHSRGQSLIEGLTIKIPSKKKADHLLWYSSAQKSSSFQGDPTLLQYPGSAEANPRLIMFHCVFFLSRYSFTTLVCLGSLSWWKQICSASSVFDRWLYRRRSLLYVSSDSLPTNWSFLPNIPNLDSWILYVSLPQPTLMRFQWTVDGSTEGPDGLPRTWLFSSS